jgi:phage host-nuclease inhibitor protein Gam
MSDEGAPKSAYELAMEKLKARGGYEEKKLTDEQKAEIADIRSRYRARIAQAEIEQQSRLATVASYEELEKLKSDLAREKERLSSEMEEKVQEVRSAT